MSVFGGLRREWDPERGSSWVQDAPDLGNEVSEYLKVKTEREILNHAFDRDDEEADEHEENDALVDEHSQVEGWDGRPLPDEEIMHRNRFGDDPSGNDRPLELASMQDAAQKMEALMEQNDEQGRVIDELLTGGAPSEVMREREGRLQAARQWHVDNGMYDDAAVNARVLADEEARVKQSLLHLAATDRESFDAADRDWSSLNANSPRDRLVMQSVLFSRDPAQALLNWHRGLRGTRSNPPPRQQQPDRRRPQQYSRSLQQEMEEAGGYGSEADERTIFADAFQE